MTTSGKNQRLAFPHWTRADFVYLPMSFVEPDVILGEGMLCISAQRIIDASATHPGVPLGILYAEDTMPSSLRAAHKANDAAVCAAYGLAHDASDADIQTLLFGNHAELVEG